MDDRTEAMMRVTALGDDELLAALAGLARDKHGNDAAMLEHIGEVDARRLYAREGYPHMFAYCLEVLRLSEGAAFKRLRAARAALRFPTIVDRVAAGELHLAGIGVLAAHLTDGNHREVLQRASGKSKRQIELLVAELAPRPDVPASVRRLPARVAPAATASEPLSPGPVSSPGASAAEPLSPGPLTPLFPETKAGPEPSASASSAAAGARTGAGGDRSDPRAVAHASVRAGDRRGTQLDVLAPERYAVRCTIDPLTRAKLARAQDLLRHQVPDGDLAAVLELALDALIDRTEKRRFARTDRPRGARGQEAGSRHVPAPVQRAVVERNGQRCAYVAASGRWCTATALLEFHHIDPHGKGGPPTIENVCLLCRGHNQYAADVDYGRALMQRLRAGRGSGARERGMAWVTGTRRRWRTPEAGEASHC